MGRCFRVKRFFGGQGDGDESGEDRWNLKIIYSKLAAAYHWTYSEIDSHTLVEVNELFSSWNVDPPTNLLVKAFLEGFGGGVKSSSPEPTIPPEAFTAMQDAALTKLSQVAGHLLPVMKGPDKNLPKNKPIFDFEELRKKNKESLSKKQ